MPRKKGAIKKNKTDFFSDVLVGVYNSNDWHDLFDWYNRFEEEIKDPKEREWALAELEKHIEKTFGDGALDERVKTELDFIVRHLRSIIKGWCVGRKGVPLDKHKTKSTRYVYVYKMFGASDVQDLVHETMVKLLENGGYNHTRPRNKKLAYVADAARLKILDLRRSRAKDANAKADDLEESHATLGTGQQRAAKMMKPSVEAKKVKPSVAAKKAKPRRAAKMME